MVGQPEGQQAGRGHLHSTDCKHSPGPGGRRGLSASLRGGQSGREHAPTAVSHTGTGQDRMYTRAAEVMRLK